MGIIETVIFDIYKSRDFRKASTVIDIGAGIGDFAVVASRRIGASGQVIAIEPDEQDYQCMLENIRVNRCPNVLPIQTAVSDKEETLELTYKGRTNRFRARRLQDILTDNDIDYSAVRYVKIDIEGGERVVIPDNLSLLRHCEKVVAELHCGAELILNPVMEGEGFTFRRIRRRDYLLATLLFAMRHPVQSFEVYNAARNAEGFHGVPKLLSGLEISISDSLIVGEYIRCFS
jgi:FkbM family methyltransferase